MTLGKDVRGGELLMASQPLGIALAPPPASPDSGSSLEPIDLLRELAVKSFSASQLQLIEVLRSHSVLKGGPQV